MAVWEDVKQAEMEQGNVEQAGVKKTAVKKIGVVRVEHRREEESERNSEFHCGAGPHEVGYDACVGWPQFPASV
jgi:hypothetical protein